AMGLLMPPRVELPTLPRALAMELPMPPRVELPTLPRALTRELAMLQQELPLVARQVELVMPPRVLLGAQAPPQLPVVVALPRELCVVRRTSIRYVSTGSCLSRVRIALKK
ncbi:hypothetical protein F443_19250, partial [Phytophthora nicotianae P1569]